MGNLAIIEVADRKTRKGFLELPYRLHGTDPCWVPPLRIAQKEIFDTRKHPFYANAEATFLLAVRNGRPVGRVAAILDRNFNRFQGEQAGFFGFFECENDPEAAAALLGAAREWLSGRGARVIRGPVNPSTNYECGILVDGFDTPPMIMMTHNPPYYGALLEGAGWRKAKDLYAYYCKTEVVGRSRAARLGEKVLERGSIRIRPVSMKDFERDVEQIWEIYNARYNSTAALFASITVVNEVGAMP